jgi:hypothetical protein
MYRWGSRRWHSFGLVLHTRVVQAETYAIKARVMDNVEKGYRGRISTVFLDKHPLRLNNSQMNSKLI